MKYLLLLVDADGKVTTSPLAIRELREFPAGEGLSVHFRPVRNDQLFESAKAAGRLAYRILLGEGVVRAQLWVEYEVRGPHVNVTGRSSDLLFALALISSKWSDAAGGYPAIAATGVLDADGAASTADGTTTVQGVQHTLAKVAAAVSALSRESAAVIFFPAADADIVAEWRHGTVIPPTIRLQPVRSLEEALAHLGVTLEKVYLGNPFRGLEPFEFEHRAIFFGREAEVREVLELLLRRETAGNPGLMVEGASGSGKSSFLRAGILPALVNPRSQSEAIRDCISRRPLSAHVARAIWRAGLLPPGADEARIAVSIRDCWVNLPELSAHASDREIQTLAELARWRHECWPTTLRFVWLIDQFEEIVNHGRADPVIEKLGLFLQELQADGVWTLASIRADSVPELKRFTALRGVFGANDGTYYLATLSGPSLDDVIRRPARAANLTFEIGADGRLLDEAIREDIYRESDSLPQLQFTLNELYVNRTGSELTYSAYQRLGGLARSIATTASAVLNTEGNNSRDAIRRLFRTLVSVDELGNASRRYAPMAEIDDPVQNRVLARLVGARLCVTDLRDGLAVVAFAHEALLRAWPELIDWLREETGLLQTREMAQRDTRLWQKHGELPAWLAPADKLAAFEALKAADIVLTKPVRTFIEQSRRRVRRATRIKQTIFAVITLLAVAASGAGWVASKKQHEAEYQVAETLKAQARLLVETAARRLKDGDVTGAQGIIVEVLTNPEFAQGHAPAAISVFQEIRAADEQLAVLSGHGTIVRSAAYSPDGTHIVTASYDKTARIWDARTGAQLAVLSGHDGEVESAAYSPDGTRIVTASNDKTARIWDARTGAQLAVLSGHDGVVESAAYSPDGARIVTSSLDKTVRIWDARTGAQLVVLSGHGAAVDSAAYSPDGTRIVTASHDKTARIWDARTGAQLAVLSGHGGFVTTAAYSPDGARIVTASYDKTAWIWNAQVPAALDAQIAWDAAAQTDGLSDVDRAQLGLPADARARHSSTPGSACDRAVAAFYDPDRREQGRLPSDINVDIANPACVGEITKPGHSARSDYEMGRALLAKHDVKGARQELELATSKGYRAAAIDLAAVLQDQSAGMLDPARSVTLLERAWNEKVPIAAYKLGHVYEIGLPVAAASVYPKLQVDVAKAWSWYQKGADVSEPDALARFAERDERNALAESSFTTRNALLLQAFTRFAAAAKRAHDEDWPDDAWKSWRYRRATLARLLAREGMMQQVADAYVMVLTQFAPPPPTTWERLTAALR